MSSPFSSLTKFRIKRLGVVKPPVSKENLWRFWLSLKSALKWQWWVWSFVFYRWSESPLLLRTRRFNVKPELRRLPWKWRRLELSGFWVMKKIVLTRGPHESLDISQVLKTIFYERSNSMMNCMQMVCLTASLEGVSPWKTLMRMYIAFIFIFCDLCRWNKKWRSSLTRSFSKSVVELGVFWNLQKWSKM